MSPAIIIVGTVVLIAVIYMVRHVRGLFKGTASCCGNSCSGGCSSCQSEISEKKVEKSKVPPYRDNEK